jgi:hypothetical protein
MKHRIKAMALCLCLGGLALLLMTACDDWEAAGRDVAKGQGTAETEIHKGETAVVEGVSTAVESYEQERERQGADACTSAALPLVVLGLVAGLSRTNSKDRQM